MLLRQSCLIVLLLAGVAALPVQPLSATWDVDDPEPSDELDQWSDVYAIGTGVGEECDLTVRVYAGGEHEGTGSGTFPWLPEAPNTWKGTASAGPGMPWTAPSTGYVRIWKSDNDAETTTPLALGQFFFVDLDG